jgi:8-oxo-dGTP pyrophosphatase MutT (NUDIX family)
LRFTLIDPVRWLRSYIRVVPVGKVCTAPCANQKLLYRSGVTVGSRVGIRLLCAVMTMADLSAIGCVGGLVLDDHGRLLLMLRANDPGRGRWSVPGGGRATGKRTKRAVRREIAEETALSVTVVRLCGVVSRVCRAASCECTGGPIGRDALGLGRARPTALTVTPSAQWLRHPGGDPYGLRRSGGQPHDPTGRRCAGPEHATARWTVPVPVHREADACGERGVPTAATLQQLAPQAATPIRIRRAARLLGWRLRGQNVRQDGLQPSVQVDRGGQGTIQRSTHPPEEQDITQPGVKIQHSTQRLVQLR